MGKRAKPTAPSLTYPKAPGLKYRQRKDGEVPYWFAPPEAVKAGFTPRAVRLHHSGWQDNPAMAAALVAHCHRLQISAKRFIAGIESAPFDKTFGALIDRYLTDQESSYRTLKPSSEHPYTIYAAKLRKHVGKVRIDKTDGRDVQRWFRVWARVDHLDGVVTDPLKHPDAKIPRARAVLNVLKAATTFGKICRLAGCADFASILSELEFPQQKPRSFAPTAAQIEAARKAAHANRAPSRALAYALQFETTLRQWDVTGIWVPLSDPRPSSIIHGVRKWLGPTWAMVDNQLVLRLTFGKTEDTSALRGTYDLSVCPMVMEELQHVALPRSGPLIVDERFGAPYWGDNFLRAWKRDFKEAKLPRGLWNRDLRAGAITEAGMVGTSRDDTRKVAGHTTNRTSAEVYDRDTLEAHRRTMALRTEGRKAKE